MIDINLLNSKKLNDSECDFFDIDSSLFEESNPSEENIGKSKARKLKKSKTNINKTNTPLLVVFATCVLLIVGGCFYYQLYYQYKSEISSQNIERVLYYFLDHESIELMKFDFKKEGVKLILKVEDESFNNVKGDIKKHLKRIDSFRDFKLERTGKYFHISYPYFVDIINVNYNENQMSEDYNTLNIDNMDKKSLKELLNDIFKINNSDLINFRITNSNSLYNIFSY